MKTLVKWIYWHKILILNIVIQILFQNHSSLKNIENKIKSLKVKVYFDKCSVCMHIPIAYKKN
jgi:hypothetical protein